MKLGDLIYRLTILYPIRITDTEGEVIFEHGVVGDYLLSDLNTERLGTLPVKYISPDVDGCTLCITVGARGRR